MPEGKRPANMCKDCWEEGQPTAPSKLRKLAVDKNGNRVPGPRCTTHYRVQRKANREKARESRWRKVYNLAAEQYRRLFEAQGGVCCLCKRANGATKALAVDHNHRTGLVRGLVCGPCNSMLAHMRDDPQFAERVLTYLVLDAIGEPFATQVIGEVLVSDAANESSGGELNGLRMVEV